MKNKNTKGCIEYLLENIYWNLIVLWCYRNVLFAVLPGFGYISWSVSRPARGDFLLPIMRRRGRIILKIRG